MYSPLEIYPWKWWPGKSLQMHIYLLTVTPIHLTFQPKIHIHQTFSKVSEVKLKQYRSSPSSWLREDGSSWQEHRGFTESKDLVLRIKRAAALVAALSAQSWGAERKQRVGPPWFGLELLVWVGCFPFWLPLTFSPPSSVGSHGQATKPEDSQNENWQLFLRPMNNILTIYMQGHI